MNYPTPPGEAGETAETILMEVAERIQLSRHKHAEATAHYKALCQYVDRPGSPLEGKVVECYPTGSFAIGAAIASKVASAQHDVDVVIEVLVSRYEAPAEVLRLLYEAISGESGSRYYGKVRRNSRCVTVTYDDGVTVDLMPVAAFPEGPARAGHLFHYKVSAPPENYHKEINPWAFKELFNAEVKVDEVFAKAFSARRMLLEKAATQPMPDQIPLEEKSSRVVALQLIKRYRDICYRARGRASLRPPPSIIMAALALEMPPPSPSLLEEVIALGTHIRGRTLQADRVGQRLEVRNPAHFNDVYTDRWPAERSDQQLFAGDLQHLVSTLSAWRGRSFGPEAMIAEVQPLFGESVATRIVEGYLEKRASEGRAGAMKFSPTGRVLSGAAAAAAPFAARASTNFGGNLDQ
jgi:hypothetical protein